MSRAFVKEQDVDTVEHLPDRPVSEHPNIVTDQGMAQIDTALAEARVVYAAAQASSERASIGAAAREVRYWSARRASAQLVPASGDTSEVRFDGILGICCFSKRGGYRPLMQGVLGVGEPAVLRRRIQTSEF